jgi:hypothetical protein
MCVTGIDDDKNGRNDDGMERYRSEWDVAASSMESVSVVRLVDGMMKWGSVMILRCESRGSFGMIRQRERSDVMALRWNEWTVK